MAHLANLEPLIALGWLVIHLYLGDHRPPRPVAAPRDHLLDGFGFTLEDRLDATVARVAYPAGEPQGSRLARTGVTKEDTLDPAIDFDASANGHDLKTLSSAPPLPPGPVAASALGDAMRSSVPNLPTLRARIAAAGCPLYLGAGTAGLAFAPPEQGVLVLGPPRSGKTTSLVIPNTLLAPGAVVSTSTKPDVIAATLPTRAGMGRCWLFDPLGTAQPPPGLTRLRWSPVPACRDWEAALLTARAMTTAARPTGHLGESAHWTERAEALLAPLLHAAAVSESGMDQVVRWVNRHDLDTASAALAVNGSDLAADILTGLGSTDSRELSGIWSTAAGVLVAYRSQSALDQARQPNFDPGGLASTNDTIYVCAPSRHQALAAPLVVGLIEQVRTSAYQSAGYRPPVTLVLDEAANIAPLPDLPSIVAEGGSQGLVTIACFQDLSQARARWGQAADGFLSLFGVKVVLPGIGDVRTLEQVSRLAGDHDVPIRSVTRRPWPIGRGGPSVTLSTRRQPRLPVDAIAHLPPGTAIVIEGPSPPTWLRLTPWFHTPPFTEAQPRLERPARSQRALPQPRFGRSL